MAEMDTAELEAKIIMLLKRGAHEIEDDRKGCDDDCSCQGPSTAPKPAPKVVVHNTHTYYSIGDIARITGSSIELVTMAMQRDSLFRRHPEDTTLYTLA